jgi:hypothetical protein
MYDAFRTSRAATNPKETAMKTLLIALIALLHLSTAFADDGKTGKFVVADTAQKFADTATDIRKQMEPGGRFEFIKPGDKEVVNSDLDRMAAMLQKSGSVAAMSADDRIKLFNVQEHLNGVLTHSDSERLVCERTAPVGSHIPTTTCRTYGEIERQRQQTARYLSENQNRDAQLRRDPEKRGH